MSKPRDLEERLIGFAVSAIEVAEGLPNTKAGNHVAGQLIRSGTSPAPNYGEARSAESRKDFIHKIKISLKELRETMVWLRIIERKPLSKTGDLSRVVSECDQLISIFVASLKTAESKNIKNPKSTTSNHQSISPRSEP
ncbi:four helix bundle protein [Verrucomicrobia bacterium]|jgi:four helix bundle protein|nr:four helix bundle protein [Verrucomicrobiota bacterium]